MSAHDTGLIGWPVAHSLSPVIHGYWREQYNIEGKYNLYPIDPANLEDDIKKLKRTGIRGFNITVPHKETIIPFLDTVDATAHHIGAVNTVVRDGPTWRGTNTDAYGFGMSLKKQIEQHRRSLEASVANVLILGAGGSARSVIVALQEAGAANISITNRTKAKADALAAEFGIKAIDWEKRDQTLKESTLVINTTTLGMVGHPPLDIDVSALQKDAVVYDLIYTPARGGVATDLVQYARGRGLIAITGLAMLVYQAQKAFQEWHGVLPEFPEPGDVLIKRLTSEIDKRNNP